MKVQIDWKHKRISVVTPDVTAAGWTGFVFARDNPDLVKNGWELWYYDNEEGLPDLGRPAIEADEFELGELIRQAVCPSCGKAARTTDGD